MKKRDLDEPPLYRVMWALLGAVIASFVICFMYTRQIRVVPMNVSYTDLAAVVLTAVTVILAVFGIIGAIAAIFGYRQFIKTAGAIAEAEATAAASTRMETFLATGEVREYLAQEAIRVAQQILTQDAVKTMIREQVNAAVFGDPADDQLDAEAAAAEAAAEDGDTAEGEGPQ